MAISEVLRVASAASAWSQTFQGKPLSKVELDSVVLTEVLRLHLLQSGNGAGDNSSEWRLKITFSHPPSMLSLLRALVLWTMFVVGLGSVEAIPHGMILALYGRWITCTF